MAQVNVPNLDRITRESPHLGEAIKKLQDYVTQNVTPVTGNRVAAPPINAIRSLG